MTYTEADIMHEGPVFFVLRRGRHYELCKKGTTHALLIGHGDDLPQVIRTAQRLERYPDKVGA